MKKIWLMLTFLVIGCAPSPVIDNRTQPTPFILSEKTVIAPGCEMLHKEVKNWNSEHPDEEPRIADC